MMDDVLKQIKAGEVLGVQFKERILDKEPPQRSWNALVYPIKPRTESVTSPPLLQQDICR